MLREKLRERLLNTQQYQKLLRSETSAAAKQSYVPLQFSPAETKLLYTLHWILLDAASECEDAEIEGSQGKSRTTKNRFLHDLSSLQLFIYLFTPIVEQLTAADFETLKLESGLSIWVPLMSYRQPVHSTLPVPVKLFDLDHLSLCHPWTSVFGPPETQRPAAPITTNETHGKMGKMLGGIYLGEEHKTSLTNQPSRAENVKPFGLNLATESIPHAEANSDVSLPRDVLWIFRVNIFH
ncbi:hypothetical protein FBUS_03245 [Fasciolopsis buskii]|uniref:Cation channel complex component UNC80 N-terminal domain-containing protein n=1 Tax=Fasciolopsis buskii TaxID=27845 RepID=A0A8E0RUN3_9TREM|nr:hypothetical protein FBUS_03245 [Fasciolopsis buski]